ncbi:conserved domain protein [, partial [[Propionibacterium] namnetense SK182B-JCVI]
MRQSKIAVAVATAAALVGSITAITPSPQASASSNTQSSISRAAVSGSNGDGIIGKDCRKAIINDAKLRAE